MSDVASDASTGEAIVFWVCAILAVAGALGMVLSRKAWSKHHNQFFAIFNEIVTIKDPNQLAVIAAERKSSMMLLPYGIPIAIGTILYFAWAWMLL